MHGPHIIGKNTQGKLTHGLVVFHTATRKLHYIFLYIRQNSSVYSDNSSILSIGRTALAAISGSTWISGRSSRKAAATLARVFSFM